MNSAVLVTSAGGVPSESTTLPAALTISTPKVDQINDTGGNAAIIVTATASAVDQLTIANSATAAHSVTVSATGSDSNIDISLAPKGTGGVKVGAGTLANPALRFTSATSGFFENTTNQVTWSAGGGSGVTFNGGVNIFPSWLFGWGSSDSRSALDTSIARPAAGLVDIGNGNTCATTTNCRDLRLRFQVDTVGTVASATTIAPANRINHITGTTAIVTITAPANFAATGFGGCIELIPDAAFTTTTGGNIALASTATLNRTMEMCYDNGTTKWYPSY